MSITSAQRIYILEKFMAVCRENKSHKMDSIIPYDKELAQIVFIATQPPEQLLLWLGYNGNCCPPSLVGAVTLAVEQLLQIPQAASE